MGKVKKLSILIPAYNEEACIDELYRRVTLVLDKLPCACEVLFVNDGSTDGTLEKIRVLKKADPRVAYVDLSRNYGKEIAMSAGIDHITGDALAIIDADLQDPPELLFEMIAGLEKGYDDVYAQRISRKGERFFKRASSKLYYKVLAKMSSVPIQPDVGDYRLLSAKAIEAMRELKESERNTKGLFSYIGFKKNPVTFERDPRIAGRTKWNYFKLFDLAIKGFTSFSVLPLRAVSITGVLVSLAAFVYLLTIVIKALTIGNPVAGYSSIMATILFLGGIQLLALGFLGEYIGVIYSETKKRPPYFINEYQKARNSKRSTTSKALPRASRTDRSNVSRRDPTPHDR